MRTKNPKNEYVVIGPDGSSETWKSSDFWKMAFDQNHPKNKPDLGYLVSQFDFDEDWESWEVHPNGDEIVFCLSGKIKFVLESRDGDKEILLSPGSYLVVPKNTWHTAKVREPSKTLLITWGYGTKKRAIGS